MPTYVNAKRAFFEAVTVLELPMLFVCGYVDPASLPPGVYQYAVRHHSEDPEKPIQICAWAVANRYGSLLSTTPIPLKPHAKQDNSFKDIDPEKDWERDGYTVKLRDYLENYPAQRPHSRDYER